jgi:hypothetical protein
MRERACRRFPLSDYPSSLFVADTITSHSAMGRFAFAMQLVSVILQSTVSFVTSRR